MKLTVKKLIATTLVAGMMLSTSVQAATNETSVNTLTTSNIEIEQIPMFAQTEEFHFAPSYFETILKGQEGNFLNEDMPVYVTDFKGNVFIQMDALQFANWNSWSEGMIEDGHHVQEFTIGSKIAKVNGQTVVIEAPMNINETIYLPLQFVGLFCKVIFDSSTNTITLQHPNHLVKTQIHADHHAATVTTYYLN